MSRLLKRLSLAALVVCVVAILATIVGGVWLRQHLRASLPLLDGTRGVAGLAAAVRIERDDLGVPTIAADTWRDLAMATGFVHGQDRFFQIDLARRRAAGELAAIFGPAALPLDREARVHRFRARARRVLATVPPEERATIEAYAAGVNAGLDSLAAHPFEYLLLRLDPERWRPEDSILVIHSMFLQLQDETASPESRRGLLLDRLPPDLAAFLLPKGTEWDTPLIGDSMRMTPTPGAATADLRHRRPRPARRRLAEPANDDLVGGSNSWALAGQHTADGAALLANDMHLGISVPHIWYRVSLAWQSDHGHPHRVTGVSLPGLPSVVVGSNGHVAWSFTNTHGDWSDLVVLEVEGADSYRTPEGPRPFERTIERIAVKGEDDDRLEVVSTVWGPVIDEDYRGRPRVLRWVAHETDGVNLRTMGFNAAHTVAEALEIANGAGIPAQNLIAVDRDGHLAWSIAGRIPRRFGFDGRRPTSWADGTRGWDGWLSPARYPRVVDPVDGRLWSANNRHVDGESLALLGDDGYDIGARARQIRDGLRRVRRATPADMLAIQLDDRALFLDRWRDLLLAVLTPEAVRAGTGRAELRQVVEDGWTGRASVDSAGYRAVRAFRGILAEMVLGYLTSACVEADPRFDITRSRSLEGPLWQLLRERPRHLLDARHRSWDDQLVAAVDATIATLRDGETSLGARTWGARNTAAFRHPLSRAIPSLARWLDMPPDRLPGDNHMPRFQSPTAGASQRMAVSPGREAVGYLHMPVGQSGHPLSPHYRDAHTHWVRGEPTPFLPGPTIHELALEPIP